VSYSTTDTLSSLIDEVISSLQGFGTSSDQVATLTADATSGSVELSADSTDNISRGVVEIDDEIIYVDHGENGVIYLPAWGRGYKGTVAASHTAGTPIWIAPTWPRAVVAREINNTIRALYPDVFGIATTDLTASSTTWQYELPADCERVLSVEWRWSTPQGWETVGSWDVSFSSPTSQFPTGRSLFVGDALPIGGSVHVTYARRPALLTNPTDPFTDTGLPASCRDLVILGAAARLVPWQDTSRLPVETVPSDVQDQNKPVGLATQVAGSIRQQYTLKLAAERRSLLDRYPTRAHRIR
jgi:hypothetical protein